MALWPNKNRNRVKEPKRMEGTAEEEEEDLDDAEEEESEDDDDDDEGEEEAAAAEEGGGEEGEGCMSVSLAMSQRSGPRMVWGAGWRTKIALTASWAVPQPSGEEKREKKRKEEKQRSHVEWMSQTVLDSLNWSDFISRFSSLEQATQREAMKSCVMNVPDSTILKIWSPTQLYWLIRWTEVTSESDSQVCFSFRFLFVASGSSNLQEKEEKQMKSCVMNAPAQTVLY